MSLNNLVSNSAEEAQSMLEEGSDNDELDKRDCYCRNQDSNQTRVFAKLRA